jgi:hypothetical protein
MRRSLVFGAWAWALAVVAVRLASAGAAASAPVTFTKPRLLMCFIFCLLLCSSFFGNDHTPFAKSWGQRAIRNEQVKANGPENN